MMNAREMRRIANANDTYQKELKKMVDELIPIVEEYIFKAAQNGMREILMLREFFASYNHSYLLSTKDIMKGVAEYLRDYGYETEITHTPSLHIYW